MTRTIVLRVEVDGFDYAEALSHALAEALSTEMAKRTPPGASAFVFRHFPVDDAIVVRLRDDTRRRGVY